MEQTMKVTRIDTNRLWMSNKEAAKYLGVSKDWLKDRVLEGRLHYSKVANTIFYIKKELDDIVRSNAVTGKMMFQKTT